MQNHKRHRLGVCLLAACVCCSGNRTPAVQAAQKSGALSVEDALSRHSFLPYAPLEFSSDGKKIAFVVQDNRADSGSNDETSLRTGVPRKRSEIDVVDVETGESKALSGGSSTNWGPSWSPDGRYLAFLSDRDGSGQARVWVWDLLRNVFRKVSDAAVRDRGAQWLPDSRRLLVASLPKNMSPDDYVSRVLHGRVQPNPPNPMALSSVLVFQSKASTLAGTEVSDSSLWNLDDCLRDLSLVDVSTGQTDVVVEGQRIATYLASPDGSRIAYASPKGFERPGSQQILYDLSLLALPGKQKQTVAPGVRLGLSGGPLSWSPDGSRLVFRTGGMEEKVHDCYVVTPGTGALRDLTRLPTSSQAQADMRCLWDPKGADIYFLNHGSLWRAAADAGTAVELARIPGRRISRMIARPTGGIWTFDGGKSTVVLTHDDFGKQDGFYKIDLAGGGITRLLEDQRCYTCVFGLDDYVAVSKNSQEVAYFSEDAQVPSDIWISDSSFSRSRRLTHLNPQLDGHTMGTARLIDWLSDDGDHLRGALLLPSGYREGQRYPLVTVVYGGENLSDGAGRFGGWFEGPYNMQLLTTRGYAVLLPDAPERIGTPMKDLAKAVLPGVNRAVELGIADPDRLGVMGHSKGGYGTLGLLVQSDRFKAAVAIDGFGDLVADYGYLDNSGAAWGT